MRATAKHLEDK
jgi:hypothetical protein